MEAEGYIAAILIGISLGSLGGGGAILTVPVFVYILHVSPVLATTYSLFVVGSCSLVGGIRAFIAGLVDFRVILYFGASSLLTIFLVRYYLVAVIPETFPVIAGTKITRDVLLMTLFALLMLLVAFCIILPGKRKATGSDGMPGYKGHAFRKGRILFQGVLVGIVSGLLGAGGGFLIIPALIFFGRLPMKTAVGSSLALIACNSLLGFFSTDSHDAINWTQLLVFTAIAVSGIFVGTYLSVKIPGSALKTVFGWFILLMGLAILAGQLLQL